MTAPGRSSVTERRVRLVPADLAAVQRRLEAFPGCLAEDLEPLGLASAWDLRRFTRALLLGEREHRDDGTPAHSNFFDIVDVDRSERVGYLWTTGQNFGFGTTLYVKHLLVDPPYRRRGYGRAALRTLAALTSTCRSVSGLALTVAPANQAAHALYRTAGFRSFGQLLFLRTLPAGVSEA